MIHRPSPRSFRAVHLAAFVLTAVLACSEGDDDAPPEPPGPVAMQIGELLPRGSETWKRGDAEPIVVGCDSRLGVTAFVYAPGTAPDPEYVPMGPLDPGHVEGDWLFRPPGACSREQCGTLLVTVHAGDESVSAEAALDTVVVDLAPLGIPLEGRLRVRAELRENGGDVVGVYARQELADELEIDVVSDECSPDGSGGAPGGSGDAGAGGA